MAIISTKLLLSSLAASLLILSSAGQCGAQSLFGTNLILNGDAEEGPASTGAGAPGGVVPVPHWTTSGTFTVNQFDQSGATHRVPIEDTASPAPGTNFFAGGPSSSNSFAVQKVDVSAAAGPIDAGVVQFYLAGYFGGFHVQNDNATLTATFLAADNSVLDSRIIGGVLAADRSSQFSGTGLILRQAQGQLPSGTRKVQFLLYMHLDFNLPNNAYNDAYADNLSFVLTSPDDHGAALSIEKSGNDIRLHWPTSLTGFTLQTATQLQPPVNWMSVTDSPGVLDGAFVLTEKISCPSQYFRLAFQ